MTVGRYAIRFPPLEPHQTSQDEAWFTLGVGDELVRLRFHDYAAMYSFPGMYEQLFYERLKCTSPAVVARLLKRAVNTSEATFSELRCLDFGAGNGMMGQELQRLGVARLVGIDILPEARDAALRDRPAVYDAYHVADLTNPSDALLAELAGWQLNCVVSVAALGFGDIPAKAFRTALSLVVSGGWVAFNIKDAFLRTGDASGFSAILRELLYDQQMELHQIERYRHRLSIDGRPLYYYAVVARKRSA
jgi:predicted TPR repeat methyltransferase